LTTIKPKLNSSFFELAKVTSLFGGTQLYVILINILRSKTFAVVLGTEGFGVMNLLYSTIGIFNSIFNLGMSTSSIRECSKAFDKGESVSIGKIITVIKRTFFILSLLGSGILLIFSRQISELTFGNSSYYLSFVFLSVVIVFNQMSNSMSVIIQGSRQLSLLAKSNILSNSISVVTVVPVIIYFKQNGIVPAIIITAIISYFIIWFLFKTNIKYDIISVSLKEVYNKSQDMIKLGFFIALSMFLGSLTTQLIKITLAKMGPGLDTVGLYAASLTIVGTYFGLIFAALSKDFFPRISAADKDAFQQSVMLNNQVLFLILLITPIALLLLIFIKPMVVLLYSKNFLPSAQIVVFSLIGVTLKPGSWALSYLIIGRGDKYIYFLNELILNLISFFLHIHFFKIWGFNGLGIAFSSTIVLSLIIKTIVVGKRYSVFYCMKVLSHLVIFGLIVLAAVFIYSLGNSIYYKVALASLTIISIVYSFSTVTKLIRQSD